jgi:hypothetical protein
VTTKKRTKLTHALRSVFVAPWFLLLPVAAVAADAGKVDFNFQIRPLLFGFIVAGAYFVFHKF